MKGKGEHCQDGKLGKVAFSCLFTKRQGTSQTQTVHVLYICSYTKIYNDTLKPPESIISAQYSRIS